VSGTVYGETHEITHHAEDTFHGSIPDNKLCHIVLYGGTGKCYCGYNSTEEEHGPEYGGEAICPSCGRPTCPRCAQMAQLEEVLIDS
jgi:hypothetical protein